MNRELKVRLIISTSIFCVLSVYSYRELRKQECAKREEIQSKLVTDLRSIHIAEGRVRERIATGKYRSWQEAMTDFNFERIVAAEE